MRAVVRFIAQCHAKGLIYRDIKPGARLGCPLSASVSSSRSQEGLDPDGCPSELFQLVEQQQQQSHAELDGFSLCPPADNFLLVNKVKMEGAGQRAAWFHTVLSYSAASGSDASEPERIERSSGAALALAGVLTAPGAGAAASAVAMTTATRAVPPATAGNILPAGHLHAWKYITRKVLAGFLPGCPP